MLSIQHHSMHLSSMELNLIEAELNGIRFKTRSTQKFNDCKALGIWVVCHNLVLRVSVPITAGVPITAYFRLIRI